MGSMRRCREADDWNNHNQAGRCPDPPKPTDDAPAYRALRLKGLQAHPEAFGTDYATSAARPIEYWRERMHSGAGGEQGITYIADAAGELIGMTALVRNDLAKTRHAGSIFGVYTRADWRGTGVADALLGACVAYAGVLGLRLVRLGVVTTNTSAIRLYQRCGFSGLWCRAGGHPARWYLL